MKEIFIIIFISGWCLERIVFHWEDFLTDSDFADWCFSHFPAPINYFFTFIGAVFYYSILPLGFGLFLYLKYC